MSLLPPNQHDVHAPDTLDARDIEMKRKGWRKIATGMWAYEPDAEQRAKDAVFREEHGPAIRAQLLELLDRN